MIETAVVIGTVGVLIVLIIGTARGLTWVAENYPKPYRWLAGTSTVGIFLAIIVDAFIVPFGAWGVSAVLLLAIPWGHAFWLRNGEDFGDSEQGR